MLACLLDDIVAVKINFIHLDSVNYRLLVDRMLFPVCHRLVVKHYGCTVVDGLGHTRSGGIDIFSETEGTLERQSIEEKRNTLEGQCFANSYLDMNPLYRTEMSAAGPDGIVTPMEVEYMASQEKFDPVFLLNLSVGKSWYIQRKYNFGFSLNVNNILNSRNVRTGGYEQTRLIDKSGERYYRFDPRYFYMSGINYMLNLYFRF